MAAPMASSPAAPDRDRLSVITAVILLAYALARFVDLPARSVGFNLFGSPLEIQLNGTLLLNLLSAALISTGSDALFRGHPALQAAPTRSVAVHWILPGLSALALGSMLARAPDGPAWWAGLALAALALMGVLVAEFFVIDPTDPRHEVARLGLVLITYALAALLFALVRAVGLRAALSIGAAGAGSALLAFRLFLLHDVRARESAAPALAIGLALAEMNWAIAYSRLNAIASALLLLVAFHAGVGLLMQASKNVLSRRTLVEYGISACVGVGAVWLASS